MVIEPPGDLAQDGLVPTAARQLVGRDEELRAIVRSFDASKDLPRAVVLSGEAGVGKTTLWLAGIDAAVASGYRILYIAPWTMPPSTALNYAIGRADTDGNPATSPEAGWLPLLVGNHPEYPSGHACFTGAVTESLRSYFGTKRVKLPVFSTVTQTTRTYSNLDDLVEDVGNARVWGGLHYRWTTEKSSKHFPRIARAVGKEHFLAGRGHYDDH
jgi:hypothetical protein